jgi:hypothetical protein
VPPTHIPSGSLSRALVILGVLLALTVGISVALTSSPGGTPPARAGELPAFSSCAQLRQHMRALALPLVTPWGLGGGGMGIAEATVGAGVDKGAVAAREGAAAAPPGSGPGSDTDTATGSGPTGTNLQEAGVDEPDLAKTDGQFVVTLTGGAALHVVDVSGAKPVKRGTLRLTGQSAAELLLFEGHALVVGHRTHAVDPTRADDGVSSVPPADVPLPDVPTSILPPLGQPRTVLTLVDLRDPDEPTVLGSNEVDGSYLSARLHDGAARVVLTSQPRLRFPVPIEPGAGTRPGSGPDVQNTALARNRALVRAAAAQDWLPQHVVRDADGRVVSDGPLLDCSAVRRPVDPSGIGMLSVLTIDTTRADALDRAAATAVVGDGDLVYASADRLYVATTVGGWAEPWLERDGRRIAPEPKPTRTKVHAFDVTGPGRAKYVASGTVEGYLLGRWAMSEHADRLRVATTSGPPWAAFEQSRSSVVVLEENGDRLVPVGSVGGLGKGERIRAVRWFGDLAAVVTFRQTDPLYLVDLSRPTRPQVLGELKVPGYSAYLHPLGDGLLLGVGQDADADGQVRGVQLSVFDVSDPARPRRVDTLALGTGQSTVEEDSRAFTYLPGRRLAVLPMWSWPTDPAFEERVWTQRAVAVAVSVGADGTVREHGRHGGEASVLRVLPVAKRLAAVSAADVTLLDPDGFESLGSVTLPR